MRSSRPGSARSGRVGLAVLVLVASSCSGGTPSVGASLGGDTTVVDTSPAAFSRPIPALSTEQQQAFAAGEALFNDSWVAAPSSPDDHVGLGPVFNAPSCSSCHVRDGRGTPPDDDPSALGLLMHLSVPGTGGPTPDPVLGSQLQDHAVNGVDREGTVAITYTEMAVESPHATRILAVPAYAIERAEAYAARELMISPRLAPQLPGVGLLEAVPEDAILAGADPDDANGDGISGRPNWLVDPATGAQVLGRLGWKANVATVATQNAGAFNADIGVTSSQFPNQPCTETETGCLAAVTGSKPEVTDRELNQVTFYTRALAIPARRNADDPDVRHGEEVFTDIGCAACHTPTLQTGDSDIPQLADQTIHPFTDLLLHDMGGALGDGRPDGSATGSEWRTAPLWGLGLIGTVNGVARYLHDGRARTLEEAILWHDGEARASLLAYQNLSPNDVYALTEFLKDL